FQYANETARRIFPELGGDDPLKVTEFISSDLADGTKERDDRRYVVRTDKGTDSSDDSMKGYLVTIYDITEHDRRIRAEEEIKIAVEREKTAAEMSLAAKIQMSSMPHDFPPFPDRTEFDIYASMEPAKEVGGDFYDFFLIDDDHLCLVIADVSGKGVPASLYMMVTKVILQSCARLGRSPADILDKTNAAICSKNEMEMFITVWLGILEISTGKVIAANAGHEYPMISDGGAFRLFKDKHGLVIGGMDGVRYTEYEFTMEHGSKLFVYTDGIPEATDASNGMFGTDRLITALNSDLSAHPEQILNNVRSAVAGFVKDAEQFDDMTMLCIEYK
ncbi:MAG: PP2C family protein-serine/threonine phosphatase, partial [Oscillospiraceae bacterium]|nr:PP2C family protein-serine/threonine phosphatase [Oscillospiraceae bacterium]